ncbi:MbtH family protein [Micromonospora craniellae]|uniref:MbtH family protein n=1 Tax=Micromonospora craniellae TaxID=2294034 RepID=A0A372FYE2_9ACTN|nr:MbtH family protein [Micromonospora craniellae]QOC93356.1 MbtH family protein [Micromonospora craniellae]RFS45802.1 MbtH family protein [Micromonospora craniellae]
MKQPDDVRFKVVVNHEEQYSVWWSDRSNPPGWQDEGTDGTRQECLDHIDRVWKDMRPRSVRTVREAIQGVQA